MMPCKPGKKSLIIVLCVTAIGVFCHSSWNTSLHFLRPGGELWSCSCHTCLQEGDSWLRELIVASPQPFLSRAYTPAAEAYNWWKRLQNEARPLSFFNTTVHNLFEIIPPVPDVAASRPDRCRSCAVVGNSGNLRGSRYGPLIDIHDIVIRMNHGRTKGYEADVGSKTTHHVMYPESAINLDNTTHLIFFPFKMKDLLWLLNSFPPGENNVKRRANKDLVMILNPAFMKYVHEMWLKRKGRYPSTGFLTLALSMHMCDMVNVFGFGADSDGNWNHYFEVLRNKRLRTGPHAGTHEYDFIHKLHQQEKIQLYQGW